MPLRRTPLLALLISAAATVAFAQPATIGQRIDAMAAEASGDAPTTLPSTAPTPELRQKMLDLLTRLDDTDVAKRDAAEHELGTLGTTVVDLLRSARDGRLEGGPVLSIDARARVDAALAQILDDDETGPSHITLDMKEASIEDVIKELNRQGRAKLMPPQGDFGPQVKKQITLKLDNATFFQAMDAFQHESGLSFQPNGDAWQAFPGQIDFDGSGGGHTYDTGAFRFFPTSASWNRSVNYGRNGGGGDNFSFSFAGRAEPKLHITDGTVLVQMDEVKDEKGNDLLGSNGNSNAYSQQGMNQFGGNVQLHYPKDPGKRFAVIRGRMQLNVVRAVDTIEVKDVMANRNVRSIEGVPVTFERAGDANGPQVNLIASCPWNNTSRTQNALQRALNHIRLIDASGRLMVTNTLDNNLDGTNTMRFTIRFIGNGFEPKGPYTLQLEVPRETKQIEVPFEFHDLAMP